MRMKCRFSHNQYAGESMNYVSNMLTAKFENIGNIGEVIDFIIIHHYYMLEVIRVTPFPEYIIIIIIPLMP